MQSFAHLPPFFSKSRIRDLEKQQAQFFFGGADFFSAKRLFFRAARDVSGVRSSPLWARVVIKLKTSCQALSHSPSHERAPALTSPPPDFLFSSIPQCPHPHIPTKSLIHPPGWIYSICWVCWVCWVYSIYPPHKKQHSLLVLPSVHTILNFATKFFEMFTKKQSEHPHKVFQVFQVFRVFQV